MHKVDTIVVGGGLAGSVLAYQLFSKGVDFVMFDASYPKASEVAAGMFNPVVFRRLLKTWMADELIPFAKDFYTKLETLLGANFYHPMKYFKILSEKEKEFWLVRSATEEMKQYLSADIVYPKELTGIENQHGVSEVYQAGWVNLKLMLFELHQLFKRNSHLIQEQFNYKNLVIGDGNISYGSYTADRIVFCEGSSAVNNPWFQQVKYKPTKGEVLTIKSDSIKLSSIVNKNGFVLPVGDNLYKVGATYEWNDLSSNITVDARALLEEKLSNITKASYEVVTQEAGIRPTTNDRRPVLGSHPNYPQMFLFNGLGTKGVLLAPYFAKHLLEHIYSGKQLHEEVDLARFTK